MIKGVLFDLDGTLLDTLDDFSTQLCRYGAYLIPYRESFCEKLSVFASAEHEKISAGREELGLHYKTVSTIQQPGLSQKEIYELLWQHYSQSRLFLANRQVYASPICILYSTIYNL